MSEVTIFNNPNNTQSRAADQKHCFSCGLLVHNSATQCPKCGAKQPELSLGALQATNEHPLKKNNASNLVYCRGCGDSIHETALSCPNCGAQQKISNTTNAYSENKSKVAAAILAFLLGGLGGHKFYLGQIGLGFLYLLFFWTFIPAIIAFIEGIIYLTMSEEEFARKYN